MHTRKLVVLLSLLTLPAACAAPPDGDGPIDIGGGLDTSAADAATGDLVLPSDTDDDTGTAADTTSADTTAPEDTSADTTGVSDTAADTGADTDETLCPGGPGCECKGNDECDGGLCIEDPTSDSTYGKVCAVPCVDSCKAGYSCVPITGGGGDLQTVCVPAWGRVCDPCTASKDCAFPGLPGAVCVDQGADGGFCGAACKVDADCDAGYACQNVKSVEGSESKQCVRKPDAGSAAAFGVCPCSKAAAKSQLSTVCKVLKKDAGGQVIASCSGVRSCSDKGLGECIAPDAKPEVCDGVDNDCNGETDEKTCDDGNTCTADSCDAKAAKCVNSPMQDGVGCDADGSVCTEGDACKGGKCMAGTVKDCDDKNPCTKDVCDLATGCTQTAADGTPCDDDNPCTIGDLCKAKSCEPGKPKKCSSGDICVVASCSLTKGGKCTFKNALDGLPCDDGSQCTEKDACKDGACTPGGITSCDDGNPCTDDACSPKSGCSHTNHTKPCDADGNACTTGETCKAGKCTGGQLKACDDDNPCTVDSCDKATGKCAYDAGPATGKSCDDGNACTEADACKGGKCTGAVKSCNDGNVCTTDTCKSEAGGKGGCVYTNKSGSCDDGNPCTSSDTCSGGKCAGKGKSCDDGNPCTKDACDAKQDCTHSPITGPCTDGDACTEKDACKAGKCTGAKANCDDGNPCTDDSCNKNSGCLHAANSKPCPDSDPCTVSETCSDKSCKKQPKTCDDGNVCTKDSCDPKKGCVSTPITVVCDDGDKCTDKDTCKAGTCVGSKVDCNDGNACTIDSCTKGQGCTTTPAQDGLSCDSGKVCKAGTCVVKVDPNKPPVAKLVCPTGLQKGASGTFDGSASSDPDGKIVSFAFDFGDASPTKKGGANTAQYAYSKTGKYTATLTVVDDKGLSAKASCTVDVAAPNPPKVVLIKPKASGPLNATQGENIPVVVDVTPPPGKSIQKVDLIVAGKVVATDTSLPYSMTYVVPANAKTGSKLQLYARAIDSAGTPGASGIVQITVTNDPPKASFTATVVGKLKVAVDGSLSSDTETATSKLQVRYDWESDGTWDTSWSTNKKLEHTYGKQGTYTIKMQVRDSVGQVTEATRKVSLSLISQVTGTIKTTTWSGTIIVTGDIIVPKGEVLTISPGTSVLFVPVDQNKDGVGDFDIFVYGKLKVQGSLGAPVTFSTYGSKKTVAKDWGRIQLKGEGSTVTHALVEYARYGFELLDTSTLSHITARNNYWGLYANSGSNTSLSDVTASNNTSHGVNVAGSAKVVFDGLSLTSNNGSGLRSDTTSTGAKVAIKDALITGNKQHGLWIRSRTSGMSVSLSDSQVSSNGSSGVTLIGGMTGTVTRNTLQFNQLEGLRAAAYLTWDVQTTVHYNNISGNALYGAWQHAAVSRTAKKSGYGAGTVTSPSWSAPSGATIDLMRVSYSEKDYANKYVTGRIRKDSSGGATLTSMSSPTTSRWIDISGSKANKVVAQAYKSTSSSAYWGETRIIDAVYVAKGLERELSVISASKTLDARHNFLGTFPDVLSVVTRSSASAVNLHGFVGKAFDSKWAKGPYWGGTTLTKDTTWSGELWVTGDLVVAAGKTLTVQPGTTVHMVRYDIGGDGSGDFDILVQGALKMGAAGAKPVLVQSFAKSPKANDWYRIRLQGKGGSSVVNSQIRHGHYGVELLDASVVDSSTFESNHYGVVVRNPAGGSVNKCTISKSSSNGLYVDSGGKIAVDSASVSGSGGDGVVVVSASTGTSLTMTKSTVSNNKGNGMMVRSGASGMKLTLTDSHIKSNSKAGVYLRGGMTGTIKRNNLLYNGYEGLRAIAWSVYDVQVQIHHNNLFGNGLTGGWVVATVGRTAKKSGYGAGTVTSPSWAAPKGEAIEHVRYSYSEKDYANKYVTGRIRKDSSGGSTLLSLSSPTSTRWAELSGVKKVVAQAYKSTSSSAYWGETKILTAVYTQAGLKRELSVVNNSKTLDARFNYLGTFPDVLSVVSYSGASAVNLHGFIGKPYTSAWTRGEHYGGGSATKDLTWDGEVWLTGDLIIPTGRKLTVTAGTKVHMVRYDIGKDGTGDFDITVNGAFEVQGTASKPVLFDELGGKKAKGSWNEVRITGSKSTSNISHAVFDHGTTGLRLESGTHVLKSVTTRNNKGYGLIASGTSSVKADTIVSTANGASGIYLSNAKGVAFDGVTTSGNGEHGIRVLNSKSSVSAKNVTAKSNVGAGYHGQSASLLLSACALTGNQVGVWLIADSGGSVTKCEISGNKAEGVLLLSASAKNPSVKINDNNIWKNGTAEGMAISTTSVVAKKSGYGAGTVTSPAWTSPYYDSSKKTRARVFAIRYGYSEKDYANKYVTGRIRKDSSSGSTLITTSSPVSARWHSVWYSNLTKLVCQAYKSTSSSAYWGESRVYSQAYRLGGKKVQLAALTDAGKVDCKNNYWGGVSGFDQELVLSRNDAIDFSGFSVLEKFGVGPQ